MGKKTLFCIIRDQSVAAKSSFPVTQNLSTAKHFNVITKK